MPHNSTTNLTTVSRNNDFKQYFKLQIKLVSNVELSKFDMNKALQYSEYTIFQFKPFTCCKKYESHRLYRNIRLLQDRQLHTKIHRPFEKGPTSEMRLIF
jgi:hypothetical protein